MLADSGIVRVISGDELSARVVVEASGQDRVDVLAGVRLTGRLRCDSVDGGTARLAVESDSWAPLAVRIELVLPPELRLTVRGVALDIDYRASAREVRLETESGRLSVRGVAASCELLSSKGGISVAGRFDDLRVATGSGALQVDLKDLDPSVASVDLRSVCGSIGLRGDPALLQSIRFETESGRVRGDGALRFHGRRVAPGRRGQVYDTSTGSSRLSVRSQTADLELIAEAAPLMGGSAIVAGLE